MRETPTILIVDNHTTFRCALSDWLSLVFKFCQVEEVETGEDALARVADAHPPQVVITDIGLPDMNGIDAVRKIKALKSETLVVVISTHQGKAYQEAALQAGAVDFVNKLEVSSKLLPVLEGLLSNPTDSIKEVSSQVV